MLLVAFVLLYLHRYIFLFGNQVVVELNSNIIIKID